MAYSPLFDVYHLRPYDQLPAFFTVSSDDEFLCPEVPPDLDYASQGERGIERDTLIVQVASEFIPADGVDPLYPGEDVGEIDARPVSQPG